MGTPRGEPGEPLGRRPHDPRLGVTRGDDVLGHGRSCARLRFPENAASGARPGRVPQWLVHAAERRGRAVARYEPLAETERGKPHGGRPEGTRPSTPQVASLRSDAWIRRASVRCRHPQDAASLELFNRTGPADSHVGSGFAGAGEGPGGKRDASLLEGGQTP